jgi:hypothetical protein
VFGECCEGPFGHFQNAWIAEMRVAREENRHGYIAIKQAVKLRTGMFSGQ